MKTLKSLALIFAISINSAFTAEVLNCNLDISNQAVELAEMFDPKDCLKGISNRELTKAFTEERNKKKVCGKCVSEINKQIQSERIPNSLNTDRFITASLNELKKGLSQTMLELVSLRSNHELKIDGKEIGKYCDLNAISQSPECESNQTIQSEIENIKRNLAGEFATYYDKKNVYDGLMEKNPNPSCKIDDVKIIALKNQYLELSLPNIVKALKNIKINYESPSLFTEITKSLIDTDPEKKLFKFEMTDIATHPLIGSLLKDPIALKRFIENSSETQNADELRERLYGKEGSGSFEKNLKDKCKAFVTSFTSKVCSKEVLNANISADSKDELEILIDSPVSVLAPHFSKTKDGMINFCQDQKFKNEKTVTFKSIQDVLSSGLPDQYKDLRYSSFKAEAYKNQVEVQRDMLCKIDDGSNKCEQGSQLCELYKIWKGSQDPESKYFKLLGAHDPNIDEILRSLIGKPTGLSENTKTVLIAQGIYPDPITKQYATSDIPERKTDYYKTEAAQASMSPATSGETTAKASAPTTQKPNPQAPTQFSSGFTAPTNIPAPLAVAQNPEYNAEEDIRNDLQKKILDRLDNQISAKQIEEMVAKAYNKGRANPLTPEQVTEKTKEVLEEMPNEMPSMTSSGNGSSPAPGGKASVSRNAAKEKKAQEQLGFLKAKYGIDPNAPAKVANGQEASTSTEKLQVVAINGAAELKIVVDDIKNIKGQEIAKLIETETPFILKIGNVSYKVSFANKKVNISIPEGMIRNPAAITKLEEYISSLAARNAEDALSKRENRKLYKNLQKVKYKE